jgi:hypothetical protein
MPFVFIVKDASQKTHQDFPIPAGCPVMSVSVMSVNWRVENGCNRDPAPEANMSKL